jgi:hypothetical protein
MAFVEYEITMGLGFFKKLFDGMKNVGNKIKVGLFGDGIDDSQPPEPYKPTGKQVSSIQTLYRKS